MFSLANTFALARTSKASQYFSHPVSLDDTVTEKDHVWSTAACHAKAFTTFAHPSLART